MAGIVASCSAGGLLGAIRFPFAVLVLVLRTQRLGTVDTEVVDLTHLGHGDAIIVLCVNEPREEDVAVCLSFLLLVSTLMARETSAFICVESEISGSAQCATI